MKNLALSSVIAIGSVVSTIPAFAQYTSVPVTATAASSIAVSGAVASGAASEDYASDAQLDSLLAPIALYPDTLLTHILIASTYPLDVVSADRWRQSNKHLTPEQVENVLEDVDWDPSVKALASFTDLLNTMASDLQWLQQLGDSVLLSQERVLDRVQVLRQHARNTGNLETNDYIDVEAERSNSREIIYIAPRQREVVYVPYYNPHTVYGNWWHPIAPVLWSHHVNYHRHRNVFWSPQIRLSASFFFGAVHWQNRHVVIHRQPVRPRNITRRYVNRLYQDSHPKRVISNDYQRWEHRSARRGQALQRATHRQHIGKSYGNNKTLSTRRDVGHSRSPSVNRNLKQGSNRILNRDPKAVRQATIASPNRQNPSRQKREAMLGKLKDNKRQYSNATKRAHQHKNNYTNGPSKGIKQQPRSAKNNRQVTPQPIVNRSKIQANQPVDRGSLRTKSTIGSRESKAISRYQDKKRTSSEKRTMTRQPARSNEHISSRMSSRASSQLSKNSGVQSSKSYQSSSRKIERSMPVQRVSRDKR